uniref:Uncharacterized protein n=1 Tax=viral metagenome TaxID=1070528 RepID=A0A6C0B8V3_9ZZZZ
MDISLTPDIYTPSVDETGNYIDNIPPINHGLKCPCGSRKDVMFETKAKFSVHCKSSVHQKWLAILNQNKANHYTEMLKFKKIVESQQKIIAEQQLKIDLHKKELESKLHDKDIIIEFLNTKKTQVYSVNLLD